MPFSMLVSNKNINFESDSIKMYETAGHPSDVNEWYQLDHHPWIPLEDLNHESRQRVDYVLTTHSAYFANSVETNIYSQSHSRFHTEEDTLIYLTHTRPYLSSSSSSSSSSSAWSAHSCSSYSHRNPPSSRRWYRCPWSWSRSVWPWVWLGPWQRRVTLDGWAACLWLAGFSLGGQFLCCYPII